jgi:hypothetical protein
MDSVSDGLLFAGSPVQRLEDWAGLPRGGKPLIRRALLAVAVSWLPLALLTALQGDFIQSDSANSFLFDLGVHARFLLAAPLLILAEAVCVPRLAAIADQFIETGLVVETERQRYDSVVASTQRLMNSRIVAIVLTVLAYALVFAVLRTAPSHAVPSWHGRLAPFAASPAGWWGLLVSLPLLLLLQLGWLWRICMWTRFLWLMNALPLQLDPANPDHVAGLGFVGSSLEGFLPIGFIVGVIAAGPVANQVVHSHVSPLQFRSVAIGAIIISVSLCTGPLLTFLRRLLEVRHRGILQYSALAIHMSKRFQTKWLRPKPRTLEDPLDMSEFTGTNALYSIAANAHAMHILPLELRSVARLSLVTFLPFVPVWLLAVPFEELAKKLSVFLL